MRGISRIRRIKGHHAKSGGAAMGPVRWAMRVLSSGGLGAKGLFTLPSREGNYSLAPRIPPAHGVWLCSAVREMARALERSIDRETEGSSDRAIDRATE